MWQSGLAHFIGCHLGLPTFRGPGLFIFYSASWPFPHSYINDYQWKEAMADDSTSTKESECTLFAKCAQAHKKFGMVFIPRNEIKKKGIHGL